MRIPVLFLLTLIILTTNNTLSFSQILPSEQKLKERILSTEKSLKNYFSIFQEKLTPEEESALTFLYAYMPLCDLADYPAAMHLQNTRIAICARNEMPWGKDIPEDVFNHFVLPARVNNEILDSFRIKLYETLAVRIKGMDMETAALEINHWCHEKVTYQGSDERTSSPLSTMRYSFGRCGEESVFTVAALRTVGIPARQVYTPRWVHSDDNHAWVEVWINGQWKFLGACEPEPKLNMGWFAGPALRAILVHARAYGKYYGTEPVLYSNPYFSELNLTANYAPVKNVIIQVRNEKSQPLKDVKVEFQVYNYAEFFPVVKGTTDNTGCFSATIGLGDILVWSTDGINVAFEKISPENADTVHLVLKPVNSLPFTSSFDFIPPVERQGTEVSQDGRDENNKRLAHEDSLRNLYMTSFRTADQSTALAGVLGYSDSLAAEFIRKSYGNYPEITRFLKNNSNDKKYAIAILGQLSEKDLRDVNADLLSDHLTGFHKLDSFLTGIEQDMILKYILNPRISSENLSPWRRFILRNLGKNFGIAARKDIGYLIQWIKDSLVVDNEANALSRNPISPEGVYTLRICDNRSRNIFFVAVCRSFGIPARLNPENMYPEYFHGGEWKVVEFTTSNPPVKRAKGTLHFMSDKKDQELKYYRHFTIARMENGFYRTLSFPDDQPLNLFPEKIECDTGSYMLVTGNRMPDGSVLAKIILFEIKPGTYTEVIVNQRTTKTEKKNLGVLKSGKFDLTTLTGNKTINLNDLTGKKGTMLVFIEPDKEPTKHVMQDLIPVKSALDKWGGNLLFIVQPGKFSQSFKPSVFIGLPENSLFMNDSQSLLYKHLREMVGPGKEEALPMIILLQPDGTIYFYSEGYKIGIGEQIIKQVE